MRVLQWAWQCFKAAQEMLLAVSCWLFNASSCCIAGHMAGALQCVFAVVEREKKKNCFGCQVPLARTGDPIFLQSLLVKLVWRTGLAKTQVPGFGSYCSEKALLIPPFFSRSINCVQVLHVRHLPALLGLQCS